MSFFKQLSQLVKTLEKDVEEFKSLEHHSQRSEGQHESAGQRAILTANSLKSEVKELEKSMKQTGKSLKKSNFVHLVSVAEALVSKQKTNIRQVEEYLQKYGYQPLPDRPLRNNQEKLADVENRVDKEETLSEHSEAEVFTDSKEAQETQNTCKQDVCTPEKTSNMDYEEVMRTPKLEDFGLSEAILNQYKTYATSLKQEQALPQNSKSSSDRAAHIVSLPPPMSVRRDAGGGEGMNIPVDFQHAGLCPTPGFSGTKDKTNRHDATFPLETPQMLRSKPNESDIHFAQQCDENSDFTGMLSLPDPPVLLTPGVKQFRKMHINSGPAPVLKLGDADDWATSPIGNISKEDNGLGSPELPVLCTPGVKQLQRSRPNVCPGGEPSKPVLSYTEDCMDTPEVPELTMGWIGLKKLTDQASQSYGSSSYAGDIMPTSAKETTGLRINPSEMFKNIDCTGLTRSHQVDLSPLPPMPELTGTYNFSIKSSSLAKNNMKSRSESDRVEDIQDSQDKENVAPVTDVLHRLQSNHFTERASRLDEISESEYSRQPDYLQRIVSLEALNTALVDLEKIFSKQEQGGEVPRVTERELHPLLDSRTKPVILALTKLGRLKLRTQGQQTSYVPAT